MRSRRRPNESLRRRALIGLASCGCSGISEPPCRGRAGRGAELDPRIRVADYDPGQVYVLQGRVGYQIDLQFDPEETFVGLAAGDIEGLTFVAQGSHLFLKPKATGVVTNLTVLTSKRQYQFEYSVQAARLQDGRQAMYVVRFRYPHSVAAAAAAGAAATGPRAASGTGAAEPLAQYRLLVLRHGTVAPGGRLGRRGADSPALRPACRAARHIRAQ